MVNHRKSAYFCEKINLLKRDIESDTSNLYRNHIKFTKNKKKRRLKFLGRVSIFITIAIISGIITSIYAVNKKYARIFDDKFENFNFKHGIVNDDYNNTMSEILYALKQNLVKVTNGEKQAPGIIFSKDGYIVTKDDVCTEKSKVMVYLLDDKTYEGEVIGTDFVSEIAVIKIKEQGLSSVKFANICKLNSGDAIASMSNLCELDKGLFVSTGKIVSIDKNIYRYNKNTNMTRLYKVVETDINQEKNKDGLVLSNRKGEIVGFNFFDSTYAQQDLNYVMRADEIQNIVNNIITNQYKDTPRRAMGIVGKTAVPENNGGVEGVYVRRVIKNSTLEKSKIRPTDIIIEVDDISIKNIKQLDNILKNHKVGDNIKCKVWRNGEIIDYNIVLFQLNKAKK